MKTLLSIFAALLLAGCVSSPPSGRAGWSISLVNIQIQLGGLQTAVDTQNLLGPNATQRHTLGDAAVSDPTTVSLPVKP